MSADIRYNHTRAEVCYNERGGDKMFEEVVPNMANPRNIIFEGAVGELLRDQIKLHANDPHFLEYLAAAIEAVYKAFDVEPVKQILDFRYNGATKNSLCNLAMLQLFLEARELFSTEEAIELVGNLEETFFIN